VGELGVGAVGAWSLLAAALLDTFQAALILANAYRRPSGMQSELA